MPAYFVAEITRVIFSVYTEWRNVTPGRRPGPPSLGNRKQMSSSVFPNVPSALFAPSSHSPQACSSPSHKHNPPFRSARGKWIVRE